LRPTGVEGGDGGQLKNSKEEKPKQHPLEPSHGLPKITSSNKRKQRKPGNGRGDFKLGTQRPTQGDRYVTKHSPGELGGGAIKTRRTHMTNKWTVGGEGQDLKLNARFQTESYITTFGGGPPERRAHVSRRG